MAPMLPVSEFNFVLCGIATIAASVGYACSRRLSATSVPPLPDQSSTPGPESKPELTFTHDLQDTKAVSLSQTSTIDLFAEAAENPVINTETPAPGEQERLSLKRKQMHDHDDNEPGNPHSSETAYPNKRSKTPPIDDKPETTTALGSDQGLPEEPKNDLPVSVDQASSSAFTKVLQPVPIAISQPSCVSPTKLSGGFASFAGSSSSFASTALKSQHAKAVWATSQSDSPNDVPPISIVADGDALSETSHAIIQVAKTVSQQKQVQTLTGEEDEEVEAELRGIKLFIKRGERDFSTGMLGHAKLLSHKAEGVKKSRIVFRREPLWKVSMNVSVGSTVRCSFDDQECILRIILKETQQQDISSTPASSNLTIYALKPGRACSKQHFRDFAASVVAAYERLTSATGED